jgi:hypothetical protein
MIAQEEHRIILRVDTKNENPEKAIQWSFSEHTNVIRSDKQGVFTIFVKVGDHLQWEGVSLSEPEVLVSISQLEYVSGSRIFSRDQIKEDEKIEATVIRGGQEDYIYKLNFRIGDSEKNYKITSKIRIVD